MASRPVSDPIRQRYTRFVAATLKQRIPTILKTAEAGFDAATVERLKGISRVIEADGAMVIDLRGWPFKGWEQLPARMNGKRPSQTPFFDFEYWMYFRILSAVRFGETRTDPFRSVKHRDLERHIAWAEEALTKITDLKGGLNLSLDANAHDLSQVSKPGKTYDIGRELLDIDAANLTRLNIIADNFGGEFVADLVLAIIAAEAGVEVVVHVKQLPIFVSDTTADDVTILLDRVSSSGVFGKRLLEAVRRGLIRFASNPFWSAPEFLDRLPVEELGTGERVLTVLKGDLNFRRAIGDVTVDVETPFEKLLLLPSAPLLSLRSIKSYCVAGVTAWPQGVSKTDFPMDGSIVAVQRIPTRATASVGSSSDTAPLLPRVRRWLRRKA